MSDEPDLKDRAGALVARAKAVKERWERTSWGKGLTRFSAQNGNVLSAGLAYFALASIAAGVVIAATLATVLLSGNPGARGRLIEYLGSAVPGLISSPGGTGILEPDVLDSTGATVTAGIAGVVSFLILVNTASRFVAGLRTSLRTMLGNESANPVEGKLRDLGALAGLAVIALVGLAIQVAASSAAEWLAGLVGLSMPTWGLRAIATGAGVIADSLYVALALIVLGGARRTRRLLWVVLTVAIGIGVLRAAVSLVVGGVTDNPVLAPFAAVITLMIFVDYVNRLVLIGAAWMGAHHRAPSEGRVVAGMDDASKDQTATPAREAEPGPRRGTPVTTRRATVRDRLRT